MHLFVTIIVNLFNKCYIVIILKKMKITVRYEKKESLGGDNMARKAYKSIVIPETLYEKIENHVEQSGGRYITISEVVR